MKKTICCLCCFALACSLLLGGAGAWYEDQPSAWARDQIRAAEDSALVSNDLIAGYSLEMPYYVTKGGGMTRYAFSEMLGNLLALSQKTDVGTLAAKLRGAGKTAQFTDYRPDDAAFVTCAYGLMQGMPDGAFAPEGELTREQAAKILALAAEAMQPGAYSDTQAGQTNLTFSDKAQISFWARDYVAYATDAGLILGVGGGRFEPQGELTVEQGTVLVYRLADKLALSGVISADANGWMWQYGVERTYFAARQDGYGLSYTGTQNSKISRIVVAEAQVNALPASIAGVEGYQLPGPRNLGAAFIHEPLKVGKMYIFEMKLRLYPASGGDPVEVTDRFTYLCGKYCTYPDDNYY
ncbi:MAG: S-layer homology domain-containing protein [Intestinibacillus sp.]